MALRGVEAVIDKDAASALLAELLGADLLLLLTDCEGAFNRLGNARPVPDPPVGPESSIRRTSPPASMRPKVEAGMSVSR